MLKPSNSPLSLVSRRSRIVVAASWLAATLTVASAADAPAPGYQPSVKVSAPTRLDWTFAVANQSPKQVPKGWLEGYDSTKQTYELLVPRGYDKRKPQAVILFVSPGDKSTGCASWQAACQELGVILAGPPAAGHDG